MIKRRAFLSLFGGGIAIGAGMSGQEGHGDTRKAKEFKGVSKKGDVEEALTNAIAAAERSVHHPDAMVNWKLKSVSGRQGGIAGFREVTVSIEAQVS